MITRKLTTDDSGFYTTLKLGPKRSKTPEGFLLCEEVPVARTGVQLYAEHEVPVEPAGNGIIYIERNPDEVFRPETLMSANGKPVTVGHPSEFVTPDNISQLGKGLMVNVRKGEGMQEGFMLADLLVTASDAIRAIEEDRITEVSLGYEADYETTSPGRGVQRNIVVNHVALVPQGRCGHACAIGDQAMASKKKSVIGRFFDAFKSKDEKEMERCAQEAEDEAEAEAKEEEEAKAAKKAEDAIANAVSKAVDAALKPMRDELEELKKASKKDDDEDDDKSGKTGDAVINAATGEKLDPAAMKLYTGDAARDVFARVEILSPGFKVPTFDAKTTDAARAVALCNCQRKALEAAYGTADGKEVIEPLLSGQSISDLTHPVLRAVFIAASETAKARNNDASRGAGAVRPTNRTSDAELLSTMDKRFKEFWNPKSAAQR